MQTSLKTISFILFCGACASARGQEGKPVFADGFEQGSGEKWDFFVPPESLASSARWGVIGDEAHTGTHAAFLEAIFPARMGILPRGAAISVHAGERYRLSAWVKAGADFKVAPKTPGVVLRATLLSAPGKDAAGGHWFVGLNGVARQKPDALAGAPVPNAWTKIEGVIEIPPDANFMRFFVFVWKGSGRLLVDDVEVALVPAGTPITPVR